MINYFKKILGNFFLNELLSDKEAKNHIREIGTNISDFVIEFVIHTSPEYHELILKIAENTFEKKYLGIYVILKLKYNIFWKVKFVSKKFTQKDINNFTYHYFIPEITLNKFIFKYLPDNKNLKRLLVHNSLWFSDPCSFSDITDCKFEVDTEPIKENILKFYYDIYLDKRADNEIEMNLDEFQQTFSFPNPKKFNADVLNHYHRGVFSKLGITCFTEKYDNKLMWDAYADGSKGVCLIFDSTILKENYYKFIGRKVRYFKSLPKYFVDGTGKMEVGHIILSKTNDYAYEHEIREVMDFQFRDQINRKVEFYPKALRGIIFGANCSSNTREKIRKLISKKKYDEIEIIESYIDNKLRIKLKKHKLKLSEKRT